MLANDGFSWDPDGVSFLLLIGTYRLIFHYGIQFLNGKKLGFRRSKILGFGGFINLGLISPKRFSVWYVACCCAVWPQIRKTAKFYVKNDRKGGLLVWMIRNS